VARRPDVAGRRLFHRGGCFRAGQRGEGVLATARLACGAARMVHSELGGGPRGRGVRGDDATCPRPFVVAPRYVSEGWRRARVTQ
jgi:hypothetical protein